MSDGTVDLEAEIAGPFDIACAVTRHLTANDAWIIPMIGPSAVGFFSHLREWFYRGEAADDLETYFLGAPFCLAIAVADKRRATKTEINLMLTDVGQALPEGWDADQSVLVVLDGGLVEEGIRNLILTKRWIDATMATDVD